MFELLSSLLLLQFYLLEDILLLSEFLSAQSNIVKWGLICAKNYRMAHFKFFLLLVMRKRIAIGGGIILIYSLKNWVFFFFLLVFLLVLLIINACIEFIHLLIWLLVFIWREPVHFWQRHFLVLNLLQLFLFLRLFMHWLIMRQVLIGLFRRILIPFDFFKQLELFESRGGDLTRILWRLFLSRGHRFYIFFKFREQTLLFFCDSSVTLFKIGKFF